MHACVCVFDTRIQNGAKTYIDVAMSLWKFSYSFITFVFINLKFEMFFHNCGKFSLICTNLKIK